MRESDCRPSQPQHPKVKPIMLRKWTDAEVARMKEMMQNGCHSSEIAAALGRTEKAVEHRKSLLRHPKPKTSKCKSTQKIELTPKQMSWLKRHYKHTKNDVIMAKLGLSHATLHRFARELGLTKTRQFIRKTQQECTAAAKESHLRNGTYPPKGYRVPRSEEFCFKKGVSNKDRLSPKRYAESQEKRRQSWLSSRAKDRARYVFGMEQRTRFRFGHQSRSKTSYRCNMKKHGYVVDIEKNVFFYTSEEMRRPRAEANAAKYGIVIRPLCP